MTNGNQFRYWIGTLKYEDWEIPTQLPNGVTYLKGQGETGEGGYRHWQFIVYTKKKHTLTAICKKFPRAAHLEPSRSDAVEAYVFKEETRIEGTQFELGQKSFKRNSATDWRIVKDKAKEGKLEEIPEDVFIRYYSTLRKISVDFGKPIKRGVQEVLVIWGPTGTGKSRLAFEMAGDDYYLKAPLTKWFDGYTGQETVIVDEFRGVIDISHMLKWLDRYPCAVEVKGSQVFLNTKKWIFTSNLSPDEWYTGLDQETKMALRRRFSRVIHKVNGFEEIMN